ncbi:MAG TPA: universal stress protein [Gammaproteobacteria bacterium]|nr:universal stress protein [Gammaproteobacteria bacterium]
MNIKLNCVIAALNLSEDLLPLAERAQQLAECMKLPLRLVHVVDDTAVINYANEFNLSGVVAGEFEQKEINDELRARRLIEHRLGLPEERHSELEVLSGPRARTLEQHARRLGARIIVVGQPETHFGSVVTHLTRHAPCDVHIVRTE